MKLNYACILLTASLLPLSTLWLTAADTLISDADQPISPAEAAQKESIQRQQSIISANQAIADGRRLFDAGKYDDAATRYQYAVDSLTAGGISADLYNRAAIGLAAAKAGQAGEAAKDAKFQEAATLLQQSISLDPQNPIYPHALEDLKRQQMAYEQQVRDPEGTVNNPAVTDELKLRIATIQKLLLQGDAYFATGQYDRSEETYSKILILDPYNKAARDKMDHIERYKIQAAGYRREEYEQEKMLQVNQAWSESISPDLVVPPTTTGTTGISTERAKITRKLQSIIIDKVDFDKLDIETVVQFLIDKSKELDPTHEGINFVLRLTSIAPPPDTTTTPIAGVPSNVPNVNRTPPGAGVPGAVAPGGGDVTIHREVSITLENVPLSELLTYITQQTNLQFSIEDYAVYLRPSVDEGETLTVRTFLVPPNFFTGPQLTVSAPAADAAGAAATVQSVSIDVVQELTAKGITFPAGATATFLRGSSKLVVRNTPDQLDRIESLIENLSKPTPQVQIEAKIAEFNQDAIKGLAFNYQVGFDTINNALGNFTSFGTQTALRTPDYATGTGNGGLSPDSLDGLIQQNASSDLNFPITGNQVAPNASNVLEVGAVLDGVGFAAIIEAINNLKGTSLISAPSITTENGLKASIDVVREFPYPSSFERPRLNNNAGLAYSAGTFGPTTDIFGFISAAPEVQMAIPPTPREFVTQDIGASLEVTPTTYPDQRIDLDITKAQVVDFDGFINYGVPITARLNSDIPPRNEPGTVITAGTINQPVFNLRSVVTNLQVLDGQTAMLGGLMTESTQEINDKVPVLGDLPLVGRLFQSKVSERTKKNLLIFITAKLVRSNGKPQYIRTLNAEPVEEKLPEPDQQIGPGVTLPPLPQGAPNS